MLASSVRLATFLALLCFSQAASGEPLRVATASNFSATMRELAERFEAETGQRVSVITGSTGKHYAQIVNGAPFDLFFAADRERPRRLEQQGRTIPGSRFTYALGVLVLWSPEPDLVDPAGQVLQQASFRYLAIANPALAPYGRAAFEVIEALGLGAALSGRLVRGENVAQAYQFVSSGNAKLGFVALAQLQGNGHRLAGSFWRVDSGLYHPIEQQAVRLTELAAGRDFMEYVRSPVAAAIIRASGYGLPDDSP
jgi:molybdate transport system substrate-binding protein